MNASRIVDSARDASTYLSAVNEVVAAFVVLSPESRQRLETWHPTLFSKLTALTRLHESFQ